MSNFSYNNRRFQSVSNSPNGEADATTTFNYFQDGDIVWATYSGGPIRLGSLIALANEQNVLDMRYQHVNTTGLLMTGKCQSTPEILPDGRIRLHEVWQWTSGDFSQGESITEELEYNNE